MSSEVDKSINDCLADFEDVEVWAEPGRYICGSAVNVITSIIGKYFYEVGGIAAMILFPLVIVFIIALFKEQILDRLMKKGTYELNDIIATMIGWLVSTILNIIWII